MHDEEEHSPGFAGFVVLLVLLVRLVLQGLGVLAEVLGLSRARSETTQ